MPLYFKGLKTTKTHVFNVGEFIDAVFRSFTTKSRFLHATERSFDAGQNAFVNSNHADFKPLGYAPHLAHVTRVKVALNTAASIVSVISW